MMQEHISNQKSPFIRLLGSTNFHILWWGTFISHSGAMIRMMATEWIVYQMTNDKGLTALIPTALYMPMVIFGLFCGVIIDMFNRKKLIIFCELFLMMIAGVLGYIVTQPGNHYGIILTLTILTGILYSLEAPARMSIGFFTFPKQDLPTAIPLLALTFQGARFIGPFFGGLMLAKLGASLCFYVNVIAYIIIMISISLVKFHQEPTKTNSKNFKEEVFLGIKHVMQTALLKFILITTSIAAVLGTFYLALMPAIAKDMLKLDAEGFGKAGGCIGIGAVCALILMTIMAHKPIKRYLYLFSMPLLGLALVILSITGNKNIAFICLGITGFTELILTNICRTTMQLNTPNHLQGRVVALESWAIVGLTGIGFMFFGWLANKIGLTVTIQMGGIAILICALICFANFKMLAKIDQKIEE